MDSSTHFFFGHRHPAELSEERRRDPRLVLNVIYTRHDPAAVLVGEGGGPRRSSFLKPLPGPQSHDDHYG